MTYKKSQKGFTLIELLVVISIISLLSSIVLTSLASAREKAKVAQILSTMNNMKVAVELYYQDNGSFPFASPGQHESDLAPYMSGDWTQIIPENSLFISPPAASSSCGEGISSSGYIIYYAAPGSINFGNVNYYNAGSSTHSGSTLIVHNGRSSVPTNIPCVSQT